MEDKNFTVDMEAYLYNTTNLYTNGNVGIDFNFEGGYDAYNWSQEKKFGTDKDENAKYSLYAYQQSKLITKQLQSCSICSSWC